MPATDPTFQYSDEDWTQITQPRLRKRVQNRVSQRKHRKSLLKPVGIAESVQSGSIGNKLRQQRASSIEAAQNSSAPKATVGQLLSNDAASSSAFPGASGRQHDHRDLGPLNQQRHTANLQHDWDGFGGTEHNTLHDPSYLASHPSWTESSASAYPLASSYPVDSFPTSSSYAPAASMYDTPGKTRSKERSVSGSTSTTNTSRTMDTEENGASFSPYELHQHYYHRSPTATSISSYGLSTDSQTMPKTDHVEDPLSPVWRGSAAHGSFTAHTTGSSTLGHVSQPMSTGNSYYGSYSVPLESAMPSSATSFGPTPTLMPSLSYSPSRVSTTFGDGMEPRGSGINPHCYKESEQLRPQATSKQQKMARRRHH
ncbi:MAG: hypothetical protein Q9181_001385 [Wetmoreana brouardii]